MSTNLSNTYSLAPQDSREQLILDNLDFVERVLGTICSALKHDSKENLFSAGVVGLVEAATRFEPDGGISFKTFAYKRIRGAIYDEMRSLSPHSQQVLQHITAINRVKEQLEPPISPQRIAQETELTIDQVLHALEAMQMDATDEWNDLSDELYAIQRGSNASPDARIENDELIELLADAIEDLDDRERLVLTLYYKEELNLKEIGQVVQLSESRVSRVLANARHQIKEAVQCKIS